MGKAVGGVGAQPGRELSDLRAEMGVSLLSQSSLKAGLDINWDAPEERCEALHQRDGDPPVAARRGP